MGNALPFLLQGAAIGAPIAGGIAEAGAIRSQASSQAQAANYNAQLAQNQGASEAERIRRAGRRELGRQRTLIGAGGVRLEGSPLELLAQNAYEIERDAMNAKLAAGDTAALDRAQAQNAKQAGRIGAGTALLTGALRGGGTGLELYQAGQLRRAGH